MSAIQLAPFGPALRRVLIEGRHAGSVRQTQYGWLPLGAFVFGPLMQPVYFRTPEEAARALARAWARSRRVGVPRAGR